MNTWCIGFVVSRFNVPFIHVAYIFCTPLQLSCYFLPIFLLVSLRGPTRTTSFDETLEDDGSYAPILIRLAWHSSGFAKRRRFERESVVWVFSGENTLHVENPLVVRVWTLYLSIFIKGYFFQSTSDLMQMYTDSWIHIHTHTYIYPKYLLDHLLCSCHLVLFPAVSSAWQAPIAPWRAMEVQMVQPWDTTRRCQFSKQKHLGFCEGEMLRWNDVVLRIFWWQQMAWKQLEFFRIEWDRTKVTKHWWYNDFLFLRKFSCSTSRCISFPRDEHRNFLSLPFEQKGCKISWGLFGEKNYPCAQNYKIIPVRWDKISPWGCS